MSKNSLMQNTTKDFESEKAKPICGKKDKHFFLIVFFSKDRFSDRCRASNQQSDKTQDRQRLPHNGKVGTTERSEWPVPHITVPHRKNHLQNTILPPSGDSWRLQNWVQHYQLYNH